MPKQSDGKVVAVIGAGFSGTLAAINIARHAKFPLKIYLIEKSGEFAKGVAYGTKSEKHLLNVPASNMSAFADAPEHFLEWLELKKHEVDPAAFYPRKLYGEYLSSQLAQLPDEIIRISQPATDLDRDNEDLFITLADSSIIKADAVILALGNLPPVTSDAQKALFQLHHKIFYNPWAEQKKVEEIEKTARVLIIGSGLTMVDFATSLLDKGHEEKITVISRHGLLPQAHIKNKPQYLLKLPEKTSLVKLYRHIRAEILLGKHSGVPWQSVIDALRPHTIKIWQELSLADKSRFERHLRVWWDTRRHRMPPDVYAGIQNYILRGKLQIKAGRICHINPLEGNFDVAYKPRGSKSPLIIEEFDYIINCAAPEVNLERSGDRLIRNLLAKDIIRTGNLHIGLRTNPKGAVMGKGDFPSDNIFALGSLRKGDLWETTAVPELRKQAHDLALEIIEMLKNRDKARQGAYI